MDTNRTNVVKLVPKGKQSSQKRIIANKNDGEKKRQNVSETSEMKDRNGMRFAIKSALYAGLGVTALLRYTAFFVLSILRFPVRLICTLFVFASLVGIPIVWLGLDPSHSMKTPALIFMGIGLVFASSIAWLYDSILLKIAPAQMMLSN